MPREEVIVLSARGDAPELVRKSVGAIVSFAPAVLAGPLALVAAPLAWTIAQLLRPAHRVTITRDHVRVRVGTERSLLPRAVRAESVAAHGGGAVLVLEHADGSRTELPLPTMDRERCERLARRVNALLVPERDVGYRGSTIPSSGARSVTADRPSARGAPSDRSPRR